MGADWTLLVTGVAIPLVLYWTTQGIAGVVKARQARKAELATNEAEAEANMAIDDRTRARRSERKARILDDYAHQLRADISNGRPPPPREWPKELNIIGNGNDN